MTLSAASEFGQYRIGRKLGSGGMGEVYQATHVFLDREVALKTLHPGAVEEHFRRLIQEARAASKLDHPNIVKVYDVAETDGIAYIAMEFIDGVTLRQMMMQRPLRLREALQYAVQIATALAAAHDVGILHRDVKPANIMITSRNVIKVVDFGLAQRFDLPESSEEEEIATRTVDAVALPIRQGPIAGTLGYMSPEQIRGMRVDARTDIFSFGVVLYEMLTRARPFAGSAESSVAENILHADPRPVREINAEIPDELADLVRFCLQKDREQRARSMHDIAHWLERIRQTRERSSGESAVAGKQQRWLVPVGLVILALIAAEGANEFLAYRHRSAMPVATLRRMTWDGGLSESPALSNDGKLLAFTSDRAGGSNLNLFLLNTGGGQPIQLTDNPADDTDPAFSPDGSLIAFRSERQGGGVYVMPSLGGQGRLLAPRGQNPHFSPDGKWILYWVGEEANIYPSARTYIVPATGGVPKQVASSFADARYPIWTPDGTHILFQGVNVWAPDSEPDPDWWVAPVDETKDHAKPVRTGAMQAIQRAGWQVVYLPGGWFQGRVVFSARSEAARLLFAIPISTSTFRVQGPPQALTFGSGNDGSPYPSPSGAIAFASLKYEINIWSRTVDGSGWIRDKEAQKLTTGEAYHASVSMSADGSRMVYLLGRAPSTNVWVRDTSSGREATVTFDPADKCSAAIAPAGDRVAWSECGPGPQPIFDASLNSDLSITDVAKICDDCGRVVDWSRNGDALLFVDHSNPVRVGILSLRAPSRTMISSSGYSLDQARFAPNGDWIALTATKIRSDRSQIFAVPLRYNKPAPASEWVAITDGNSWDDAPVWSEREDALLFYSRRDGFGCIWRQGLNRTTKWPEGPPVEVLKFHNGRLSIRELNGFLQSMSLVNNKLLFNALERTGSVWIVDERPGAPTAR
jgi:serine/threonine protein kinase/Tol biopolymer transport system component